MPDRTHRDEAPGPEVGGTDRWSVDTRPEATPRSAVLRADGGEPPGGLFARTPEPGLRYELDGGTPVVTGVNEAYDERFGGAGDVPCPLVNRLRADLEPVTSGDLAGDGQGDADGDVRIEDVGELAESAAAGTTAWAIVRGGTDTERREYRAGVVPAGTADGDRDAPGRRTGGYVVLTDVSALFERTRRLAEERDRLEDFASTVSHDLRNPLEVARIQLEVARERGDEVHFDKVEGAHDRMEQIIDTVLTLARQGRDIDDVGEVDLSSVANDAWDSVAASEATMSVEDTAVLQADRDRLQALLENLFRNACEHADAPVTVTVGPTGDGFYVADDGPGIPEADREAVFEGGYSTDPDGTGLGLVIVERIAEAHGWSVSVGDAEGSGARFDVSGADVD